MDNQISEVIILAGGLGTRLQSTIGDIPKPLAPVNNKPFLHYLFEYLKKNKISTAILSVGYKWEMIQDTFGEQYLGIDIKYAVEKERLGTGGGIKLALDLVKRDNCFVMNGDTFFGIDLQKLANFHLQNDADLSLAGKQMTNFDRYGTISIRENGTIASFNEKAPTDEGVINGGVYCIKKNALADINKNAFSLETDFLEANAESGKVKAMVFHDYFIDIGIPKDYAQFEKDLTSQTIQEIDSPERSNSILDLNINNKWTLFLDRDGVINVRLIDDYVKQLNELRIIDGVPEAIADFSKLFKRVLVVTNQQGIGKGMMTAGDLELIHGYMNNIFQNKGGRVDKFYFAPQLASEDSNYRKPGSGMGLAAQQDYPDIDFSKCLMIGDSESDIEFGMNLGMKTVLLTNVRNISTKADYIFNNLQAVATKLKTNSK